MKKSFLLSLLVVVSSLSYTMDREEKISKLYTEAQELKARAEKLSQQKTGDDELLVELRDLVVLIDAQTSELNKIVQEEPASNFKKCKWFNQVIDKKTAFNNELEYLRHGKRTLKKELNGLSLWQKIWNYSAYKRSQKTYEVLQQEIDIFNNKENKLYKINKNVFNQTFRERFHTARE